MQDHSRYSIDAGFCNILVRGVPVVYLDNADRLLGSRDYALIKQERFERELMA